MADYQLYCFAQSGNAYKSALMLNLCGADWAPHFVDFFNGETRTEAFRAINPMGEVPVLDHGGKILTQSGIMLDYLAEKSGKFGHDNDDERQEIWRWILFDNHKLTANVATYRFLLRFAKTGETPVTDFLKGRMKSALKVLDGHLSDRDFVAADRPTIADISLAGYLFWPDEFDVDWDDFPSIGSWLKRIEALPGWVHPYELMPGHPLPDKA
ncbi:MAG: glutathione S-transferase family protein [Geminicoccaceae bacterium]